MKVTVQRSLSTVVPLPLSTISKRNRTLRPFSNTQPSHLLFQLPPSLPRPLYLASKILFLAASSTPTLIFIFSLTPSNLTFVPRLTMSLSTPSQKLVAAVLCLYFLAFATFFWRDLGLGPSMGWRLGSDGVEEDDMRVVSLSLVDREREKTGRSL